MNDKQMIEKIRTTFVGEDYIDLAVRYYCHCRKTMSIDKAHHNVLRFLNDNITWFRHFINNIVKVSAKSNSQYDETVYTLENKWSIKITKWPDGYEVRIHKPDGKILNSECGLDFEDARKMVEEWKYETATA